MSKDKALLHCSKISSNDEYIQPFAVIKFSNKIKSRGVFSTVEYNKGDIIEIAPALMQQLRHNVGVISDYTFGYDDKNCLIGYGYTSMYNHADKPNAYWDLINDNKVVITAQKKILPDEEIFISYGDKYFESRDYINKITK
jgi:hypothetical protein